MGEHPKRNPSKCRYPKLPRVQVPSSEWDSFLMKGLNAGQKRYFYSILSIYDSRGQREALSHRYAIGLQRQNALGECQPRRGRASAIRRNWRTVGKRRGLRGQFYEP
ncbi:hypothetical protein Chor_004531 [Crotalus horridus]